MSEVTLIERIVLDEVAGKNNAIHAYDKMIWTVRTGYLTLFFAGWGILLKALIEKTSGTYWAVSLNRTLVVMFLVSLALSVGAFIVDQNYVRRKFRVIKALDALLWAVAHKQDDFIDCLLKVEIFWQVSGDEDNKNYREVSGYKREISAGRTIYFFPVALMILAVFLLWNYKICGM